MTKTETVASNGTIRSNNDNDEFVNWYQDAIGSGLSTMDPPVLTYFPEDNNQVYYPEDIYIKTNLVLPRCVC